MTNLFHLADELQRFMDARGWQFCFIGGLAVQYWGEPRLTRDVDVALLTGFGNERHFVEALLEAYQGRIPDAMEFALANRVLLLKSLDGSGIDVSLAALPFEVDLISRSTEVEVLPGCALRLCSAEDLIILKAFASRPTDWRDVESVIARQQVTNLDWGLIERELSVLSDLKEEPETMRRIAELRRGG